MNGDHVYFAARKDTSKLFSVDEISIKTTQAPITEVISHVVVLHRVMVETLLMVDDPTLPDNQFRVEVKMEDPDYPPKPENYIWEVLIGSGTIDDTGLVTHDPSDPYPWIVVTTKAKNAAPHTGSGCAMFPWPKMKPSQILPLMRKEN
ncbi:hypothetical protein D3C73_871390 [compost metagenome]